MHHLLKQLHWLPVSSRIQFKLCTLMFDFNYGTAPRYLSELVRHCDDTRLRSNVRGNFVVSRFCDVWVSRPSEAIDVWVSAWWGARWRVGRCAVIGQ